MARGPEYWAHFLDDLNEEDYGGEGPHLITADELRAAGALDVPPEWRKSLGGKRDSAPRLFDGGPHAEQQQQAPGEPDGDAAGGENSAIIGT